MTRLTLLNLFLSNFW